MSPRRGPDGGRPVSAEAPSLVDLHNHLVPAVDDGARTVEEAIATLREFAALGVRRVATTPHLAASRAAGPRVRGVVESFAELRAAAAESAPEIELSLGFEIRLDEPDVELSDPELGLGDRHLLVEFSMLMMPAYPVATLETAIRQGWIPVLAHPERYAGVAERYPMVARWREAGALMCVNSGSLQGLHGREAEWVARRMLADGAVDLIASDNHARPGRCETVRAAWDLLVEGGFEPAARLLLRDNPAAVLDGRDPQPVPPIHLADGWSERLRRLVGWSR